MGVLTVFYRVKADMLEMLEINPELMDWLLGYSVDKAVGEKLGFKDGIVPPHLNIDKAWDEILILLAGTNQLEAYQALDIPLWEEYDGCEEIRFFSPDVVKSGLEVLKKLNAGWLREEALECELRTYNGDLFEHLLDYTLSHLESLTAFWQETVEAGEGIVAETG